MRSPSWDSRSIYAFTSENISGYFHLMSCAKTVLSVAGSGDHALNAILAGAKKLELFDINAAALYWTELKVCGVRSLEYDDFRDFFLRAPCGRAALDFEIFTQLSNKLSNPSYSFFKSLFAQFDNQGDQLRESPLFNLKYEISEIKISSNPYLKSIQAYNDLRTKLSNCEIIYRHSSLRQELRNQNASSRFDLILLSNLSDYLTRSLERLDATLRDFISEACLPLLQRLSRDGKLIAAYLYDLHSSLKRSTIDFPCERSRAFESCDFNYQQIDFGSVIPGAKDAVLVMSQLSGGT